MAIGVNTRATKDKSQGICLLRSSLLLLLCWPFSWRGLAPWPVRMLAIRVRQAQPAKSDNGLHRWTLA